MSPRQIQANLHRRDDCLLAEGPFWHEGKLWWVDIDRGRLLSANSQGNLIRNISVRQCLGAAVPSKNGTFLVGLERELAQLDLESERWKTIARPDDLPVGSRFNDGKCDPMGRWIIGTTSHGPEKTSSLYSLHPDHSLHRIKAEVCISNGLAWSPEGGTMYYIDTLALSVCAFDYDLATGSLSGERVVLRFSEKEGWPDGMTIDREGQLWIAFWDGWSVRCYRPETGLCEAVVKLPCARVTSCCFGGAELDHLFITTARCGLNASELTEQPLSGSLFVCDPGTSGFPTSLFQPQETGL